MHHLRYTLAAEKDLVELNQLVNSAYRGDTSRQGWTTEADLLDGQRTDLESLKILITEPAHRKVLLLRDDSRLLACVSIEKHSGERCYLGMLTVVPDTQNQGLGKKLLLAAEHEACAWGCTHMCITVIQLRTALIDWYKRFGYVATGEKKPFPYGQPKFGIPKREDLYFEVFEKPLPL